MAPPLLRRVGLTLYGPQWRAPLAAALRVDERTVRRWAKGTHPIPDGVRADLLNLVSLHGYRMTGLMRDLEPPADRPAAE